MHNFVTACGCLRPWGIRRTEFIGLSDCFAAIPRRDWPSVTRSLRQCRNVCRAFSTHQITDDHGTVEIKEAVFSATFQSIAAVFSTAGRRASLLNMGFSTISWTRQAKTTDAVKPIAMIASAGIGNFVQSPCSGVTMKVWTR